ncbi:MAG: BamA/TamA family outer membrane protein [Burkholderiaceae bacterium]|nr:BamA/TamA family outer membrane protein [Sulfuritalea sp.]MCF8175796.1 BamA/TamA family outer membrane protein [Burkholderiaceae bacterium]MCF8184047.1 BamA/TamA family outer membrane protein [Polynucleobacter sp.]
MNFWLVGAACLVSSGAAFSQTAPSAGELLKTVPPAVPRPSTDLKIDDALSLRAVADVEGMSLDIKVFRISGLTAVAEADLAEVVSPFIGSGKRFQDLLDAAAAVKRELAGRGFFLADVIIPEQKIADGAVELRVLEGRLGKIVLEVDPAVSISQSLLESYLAALREGGLIRTSDVERALFQFHDLRGIVARSSFAPGATPGTADLTIKVSAGKPFDANIDLDANGSIYTGQHRVGAGIDGNNLLGYGELINLRASNAIDGDLRFARASILVPVGPWGTKVGGAYTELKYRLGTPLFEAIKARGAAAVNSFTAIHPIVRSRNTNLLVIAQHDKRKFYDIQAAAGAETFKKTDVSSLGLSGDFRDTLGGGGINVFSFAYTLGDLKFGNEGLRTTDLAGRKTGGLYGKTNISMSRLQAVSERLALYGSYSEQFTNKNLDASEKISLGGPNAVRAYPQGEGAGDRGYFATIELRYRMPLEETLPGSIVLAGFYDFGRSILINRPTNADFSANAALLRRIAGPGIGINWEVPNDWYLRTTLAFRDTTKAEADHLLRFPRLYFQFSKFF